MWHEARKSEKKVLGMMVDMQKRAERRRAYYDKLGEDSMQLLRLTGAPCTIHLEPSIAMAAENSTVMIPLRCDADILIDRWDVRASMDVIPNYKSDPSSLPEMDYLEQQRNYERYRVLVQNESRNVVQESYLQRIDMEELYPKSSATKKAEKKKLAAQRAAIGYKYDRGAAPSAEQEAAAAELAKLIAKSDDAEVEEATAANSGDKSSDEEDVDRDRDPPIQIDQNNAQQKSELNRIGLGYGLSNFTSMVASEIMEAKVEKEAEEMGNALSAISSRASKQNRSKRIELRREKDQLLMTIPSYAQRASPTYEDFNPDGSDGSDSSGSESPVIEIISGFNTSTGAALKSSAMTSLSKPVGSSSSSSRRHTEAASWSSASSSQHRHHHSSQDHSRHHGHRRSRSRSCSPQRSTNSGMLSQYRDSERSRDRGRRSTSRSRDRSRRSRSRSRDRNKERDDHRSYDKRSPQRSYNSSHFRSRSRSRSPDHGVRGDDGRAHRSGPEASRDRSTTATEAGASAATKKLVPSKGADKPKLTPQEKLKLKMKLQLSRTQRTDRAKEVLKAERQESQRQERMDEITEQTRKHREKERQRYHEDDDRHYGERSPSPGDYDQRTDSRGSGGSSRYR